MNQTIQNNDNLQVPEIKACQIQRILEGTVGGVKKIWLEYWDNYGQPKQYAGVWNPQLELMAKEFRIKVVQF